MALKKRVYSAERLPVEEDLSGYAIPYTPEVFTAEEKRFLTPFFSNLDRPVFVVERLPEEVIGALSSRYSRSTKSLRRMFLSEYIEPIVYPERQKGWTELSREQRREAEETRDGFLEMVDLLSAGGGLEKVVNVQRGRKFFDTWLAQYGDDSIAEMGNVHVCIEGASVIAIKEFQDKRIGISPLEKSTRYVQFGEKRVDGEYLYIVPGEIRGTPMEEEYREVMDGLFEAYVKVSEPHLEFIKKKYPRGEDETERSFEGSRSAKRFDDIRDILPWGHQSNFAMSGNGRAFEDVINRCLLHPLGEVRWWGQQVCNELEKVVPSFVRRPKTLRGAEAQMYRYNVRVLRDELYREVMGEEKIPSSSPLSRGELVRWVKLVSFTPEPEVEVIASFLYGSGVMSSLDEIRRQVEEIGVEKRKEIIRRILDERILGKADAERQAVRFRKVPRAFENAHFLFDVWGRGSGYKDLQRHRMLTVERQQFGCDWGYDLEKDLLESPVLPEVERAFKRVEKLYKKLLKKSRCLAQYVVPYAYIQRWYMNMTAREVYWMVELRTGPQGNPHYREIAQQIGAEAGRVAPDLFEGLRTDWNDYSLARRESEKKIERKLRGK